MEQIILELENIEVNYLDKEVLHIGRLAVHQFDRIGIVGKNGSGKSTLLKLLAGKVAPSKGKVSRHSEFGCFEQVEPPENLNGDPKMLGLLNVPQSDSLSGGEQTRLKLAQLFSDYHEALLIDEPTTHLDREGIAFLIDELKHYYGALLLVSHDRNVLDALVDTIWEIDGGKVTVYSGNYSDYKDQKELERKQQTEAHELYVKEKKRLEKAAEEKMKKAESIAKSSAMKKESKAKPNRMVETKSKGTAQKALQRAAKSIGQRLDRLEQAQVPEEERAIAFHHSKTLALHNKFPIMADRMTLSAGENVLLEEVSFQFPLGKKIAITGGNGTGKTTLLEHIAAHGDGLIISPKVKIGYFRQMSYQFTEDQTVLEWIRNRTEYKEGFLRGVLKAMMFEGTDLQKNVKSLSGGEAVRLQLCELFLGQYNILLLDEPTNFLDIQAIEALERFLASYEGTIIYTSHDQAFVEQTAEMQFRIQDQKILYS